MPQTEVVIYKELDESVPLLEWMDALLPKVQDKLVARIDLLKDKGYDLRRPHADLLRDGIHELRAKHFKVHYRMLYFFHGKIAVLSHGLTKEGAVPDPEIDIAVARHNTFAEDPEGHTHREK